ncbi:MAG: glycosyltransferase family 9 protein [Verrucomicrobia bacterium]|nr:glycosyltransferase family 9 protein [Verrucomicrobiota bacterium]MCH8526296.1 glycosyltransferase family 9 protein [Kiritimatiellia bacterium]
MADSDSGGDSASRILVVKLSALGDLFHAVPIVHALKRHYGGVIDWVTQPEYADLAACHTDVNRVLCYPRRGGVGEWRRFLKDLRCEQYDLVCDFQGLFKSGLVLGLSRGRRKISVSAPREFAGWFADEIPVSSAATPHAMDRLADTLRHLGVAFSSPEYPMAFPPAPPLPGKRPRLGIAPRSRWPAKDWPKERFSAVIRALRERCELDVVILGGPGDVDVGDGIARDAGGGGIWNVCGQSPLIQLGTQLAEIDVLLCNDSGPMHFAAAVGTPVVALFGPTDPQLTGPVGEGHTVLRPEAGPGGYPPHRSYKDPGNGFISKLSAEEVTEAVWRCLQSHPEPVPER